MTRRILPILLVLAATAQGAFVTKARWAARGVKDIVIDVADGKPRLRATVWTVPIEKDFPGAWPGTHRAIAKGREFDLPNGRVLRWETSDSLTPFEVVPGELAHLAEWGAHITSIVFAAAPPAGFTIAHKLTLGVGTVVAYQPELTQAEKDEGCARPRAVVGSYAVFDASGCKIMHIPCPVLIDAAGTKVWGTIQINPPVGPPTGVFTSIVSFKAVDFAGLVFPVTAYGLDTFGYSGAGGSSSNMGAHDCAVSGPYTPGSNGTATTIHIECANHNGDGMTAGLYLDNAGTPDGLLADTAEVTGAQDARQWVTFTIDGAGVAVTTAQSIWIAHNRDDLTTLYWDADTATWKYDTDMTYVAGTLENPWTVTTGTFNRKMQAYVTFAPTVAGGVAPQWMHYFRQRSR